MDRHYITNLVGEDIYHPRCISFVDIINKLSDNELLVLECGQVDIIQLAQLKIDKEMTIKDLKIKRII
jgi:hypothetical protein